MNQRLEKNSNYKTELEKNGVIAFVPRGNSMWPIFKNQGQSVIIERTKDRLKRFDVALYQRADGAFVLHRVMQVEESGYVFCGDSQFTLEPVKDGQILGKMIGFYHKDKYVVVTDARYVKKVEKWYARKLYRKLRLKVFYKTVALKARLNKIFSKKGQK